MSDALPPRGRVYKFKKLIFWAQGGTICIEDVNDGSFRCITAQDFAARRVAVRDQLTSATRNKYYDTYPDERALDSRFVDEAKRCIQEALRQGDPFDPRVLEHFYRHRRPSLVHMGGGNFVTTRAISGDDPTATALVAELPPLPAQVYRDRDAVLRNKH